MLTESTAAHWRMPMRSVSRRASDRTMEASRCGERSPHDRSGCRARETLPRPPHAATRREHVKQDARARIVPRRAARVACLALQMVPYCRIGQSGVRHPAVANSDRMVMSEPVTYCGCVADALFAAICRCLHPARCPPSPPEFGISESTPRWPGCRRCQRTEPAITAFVRRRSGLCLALVYCRQ
jgi:hypothetical protein